MQLVFDNIDKGRMWFSYFNQENSCLSNQACLPDYERIAGKLLIYGIKVEF